MTVQILTAMAKSLESEITGYELDTTFGVHLTLNFPNGYAASVVRNDYSYGHEWGLYELAVLRKGRVVYDTPITDDVIASLDQAKVVQYAMRISQL